MPETTMMHGAAVTPVDRHARKRSELADAETALAKVQEAKGQVVREAEESARAAVSRHVAAKARGQDLRWKVEEYAELAERYLTLADEVADEVVEQEIVIARAEREAEALAAQAMEIAKPFRRQEVPLERKIESLRARLGRAERRGETKVATEDRGDGDYEVGDVSGA